jgi:hypothetical protein
MKNTPTSEAVSSSASQAIGPVLLNPKVHYLVHNSQQAFPILSHINSVHVIPAYFWKTQCAIIHQYTPRSHKRCLSVRVTIQKPRVPHSPPISTSFISLIQLVSSIQYSTQYSTVYSTQYTVRNSAAPNAVSCYLLLLRLLCAVRSDCACSRTERRVQYAEQPHGVRRRRQGQITVTFVWADVWKILQTCARNITLVPMKAYGGSVRKSPHILKVDTRDEWLTLRSSRFIPVG